MRGFFALLARDLLLAVTAGSSAGIALGFYAVAVLLFPLGVGPEPALLARIAAGILWVCGLLASLLSLERLFHDDAEDGSLDLLGLSPLPLEAVVLAKVVAHWLLAGLPLIVLGPLLGAILALPGPAYGTLALTLLLGTPCLALVGAVAAALVLGARRGGGALLGVLALPLYIPALIFAVSAIEASAAGLPARPHLLLLGGLLVLALPLAPIAAAAALRQNLE